MLWLVALLTQKGWYLIYR